MDKMNSAIVGCGAIFSNHADAVAASDRAKLYAVCDRNVERARAASEKYGCRYYSDYQQLLRDEQVKVIHICTPHYLHAPMAIEAMRSGRHVLTEKPMAIRSHDAEEMIRVSKETGKILGVCFQNRYNSTSLKIKELLKSGETGGVMGVKATVTWHRDEKYYTESGWRGTWEKEGGGVLINQSIHTLDLLQWFMGEVDAIKGNVDIRLLENVIEVEDTADALIKFKNGTHALFFASNCYAANAPVEIELICEKAVIRLSEGLTVKYADGKTETYTEKDAATGAKAYWGSSHKALIDDFYDCLVEGKKFSVPGMQGITALKMIEAIYASSKNGEYIMMA